jgi:hypothetical protein
MLAGLALYPDKTTVLSEGRGSVSTLRIKEKGCPIFLEQPFLKSTKSIFKNLSSGHYLFCF